MPLHLADTAALVQLESRRQLTANVHVVSGAEVRFSSAIRQHGARSGDE